MPTLSHRLHDGNVQEMRQAPVASAQTVHARVRKDNHRVLPLALVSGLSTSGLLKHLMVSINRRASSEMPMGNGGA